MLQKVSLSDINEEVISDDEFLAFCRSVSYTPTLICTTDYCSDDTLVRSYRVEANVPDGEFLQDDLKFFFMGRDD